MLGCQMRTKERRRPMPRSRNVAICRRVIGHSLHVLAVNQTLEATLDHVHIGREAGGHLREDFGHQLSVGECLSLPERKQLVYDWRSKPRAERTS